MTATQAENKTTWRDILRAGLGKNRRQSERDKFYRRKRELEAAEAADERETKREAAKLRRQQIKQAQYYAGLLPRALAQQEQFYVEKQYKQSSIVKRKKILIRIVPPVVIHHDYYMFLVDTSNLPTGVTTAKLADKTVLESLGFALQTEVSVDNQSKERGFWYLVARRGGVGIVPRKINYADVITMMPKRASSWAIPIGVGENKRLTWLDIRQKPHFLIAGGTGSGNSVFLKNMLLTLCAQNSPERLRIVLADFKAGADLIPLKNLPHLGTPTKIRVKKREIVDINAEGEIIEETVDDFADEIINEPADLMPVLQWADRETNRRNRLFAQLGTVTNINEYNGKFRRKPLPRILLVLDEFPVAMLEVGKTEMKQIEQKISPITRKGRSAGISVVLGSQVASANVLSGAISQNISTRLGGFSTGPQSQVIMGSWIANRIENRPGRMAYRDDLTERELQTPWISQAIAKALVAEIGDKWSDGHDEDSTALMLFKFCLDKSDGIYDPYNIHKYFPDDEEITREVCVEIGQQYELTTQENGELGPIITLLDTDFYLLPSISGLRPRKLITVEDYELSQTTPEPEPKPEPVIDTITNEQILRWSIYENEGRLGWREIFARFANEGVTAERARTVFSEGGEFEIDDNFYRILQGAGPLPRRAILAECGMRNDNQPPNAPKTTDTPVGEAKTDIETDVDDNDEIPDWLQ